MVRRLCTGVVAGAVSGVLPGVLSRVAMRVVALGAGDSVGFSLPGTLVILLFAVGVGVGLGALYAVWYSDLRRLPGGLMMRGLYAGLAVMLVFGLPYYLFGLRGAIPQTPPVSQLLFYLLPFLFGTSLAYGYAWLEPRWPVFERPLYSWVRGAYLLAGGLALIGFTLTVLLLTFEVISSVSYQAGIVISRLFIARNMVVTPGLALNGALLLFMPGLMIGLVLAPLRHSLRRRSRLAGLVGACMLVGLIIAGVWAGTLGDLLRMELTRRGLLLITALVALYMLGAGIILLRPVLRAEDAV